MHLDTLEPPKADLGSMKLTKEDWKRTRWTMLRQSPIGFLIGVLPGAGGSVASLLSYATEKQISKNSKKFGKGAIEGVAAPEASNNAASVGSLIPLLTMGVPGSGTTAVILGAVVMLGLQPGPLLFEKQPEMIWTLVNSMFIGNIFLVILNIALIGLLLKLLDFPISPLILAAIIGSDMEQNFRKSLITSQNHLSDIFFGSPIAIVLTLMTLLSLCYPFMMKFIKSKQSNT